MKTRARLMLAATALLSAGLAHAATSSARVTVVGPQAVPFAFSAPIFRWENLSTPGLLITSVEFYGGAPIDFVFGEGSAAPYDITNPAGGTRTILRGSESLIDENVGCTNGISYGLTSFSPGDSFEFTVDPEGGGCGTAVVDYRPFLRSGDVTAAVTFSNGRTLLGNVWAEELVDPQGADVAENQRFVLNLSQTAVPEPASWAMLIAGFGFTGATLRRRRLANRIVSA